ncbi:MAG: hypothetical protein LUK37_02830 [Clostridia bacterium]|nr:hypothetical protein [Clostridia bacterium]
MMMDKGCFQILDREIYTGQGDLYWTERFIRIEKSVRPERFVQPERGI